MAEPLDPAVQARLARLAARGRVARPTPGVAASPPPLEAFPVPTAPPVSRVLPPPPGAAAVRPIRAAAPPRPAVARRPHPAEGSRLVVGVLSVATALGLVAGLAWGSNQPATAQPSANPPVVVVPDPSSGSGSGSSVTPSLPVPTLPAPSTNSGGS